MLECSGLGSVRIPDPVVARARVEQISTLEIPSESG